MKKNNEDMKTVEYVVSTYENYNTQKVVGFSLTDKDHEMYVNGKTVSQVFTFEY